MYSCVCVYLCMHVHTDVHTHTGNLPGMDSQFMEALKKQIEDNMRKAFWDMLTDTLNSENPDYEWVVRLYR
jgi:hypothetical protein